MGANSPEFNLNFSPVFVPKTISDFLTELSAMADVSKKLTKLNDYVNVLEDELRKIDAFKRELPLCMLLLGDAIERLKEETTHCTESGVRPVMEEFIPLKCNSNEVGGVKMSSGCSDKKNWMSSAQLWSTQVQHNKCDIQLQESVLNLKSSEREEDGSATEKSFQLCNFRNRGGAFVPFKRQSGLSMKEDYEVLPVHGLSLSMPVAEMGSIDLNLKGNSGTNFGPFLLKEQMKSQSKLQQQQRKRRRCWSPELHGRFVNALKQLGGAQAATPKQIRELMQVDGLTNDEVKSHLQKYRLHVRKLPASSAATSNCLWFMPDRCGGLFQPGSPEGPLHLAGSAKGVSITRGESMEEEEDEKSESYSWKGQLHKLVENDV